MKDFKDIGPSEFTVHNGDDRRSDPGMGGRVKNLAFVCLVILCFGGVLYGVVRAVPIIRDRIKGSPMFRLEGVDVIGIINSDHEAVTKAIGFTVGTPVLETDLSAVRDRVMSVDWVKDVEIQRKLPNRIVVIIKEHTPVGVVLTDNGPLFVDPDGQLIEINTGVAGYPVFFGMDSVREYADGAVLVGMLYEKKIIAPGYIASISYDRVMGYTVFTSQGVELRFGSSPFDKKVTRLVTVLADAQRRGPIEYIYLNIEGRIIVKNDAPVM